MAERTKKAERVKGSQTLKVGVALVMSDRLTLPSENAEALFPLIPGVSEITPRQNNANKCWLQPWCK